MTKRRLNIRQLKKKKKTLTCLIQNNTIGGIYFQFPEMLTIFIMRLKGKL
jgi:hypothetical protein